MTSARHSFSRFTVEQKKKKRRRKNWFSGARKIMALRFTEMDNPLSEEKENDRKINGDIANIKILLIDGK